MSNKKLKHLCKIQNGYDVDAKHVVQEQKAKDVKQGWEVEWSITN